MTTFRIDFFELMFLAESVIPPNPIARSVCFSDFSEKHYHKMTLDERFQFFEHVQKYPKFTLENEDCRHFFARYNPKNQYRVIVAYNEEITIVDCYFFDEEYRTGRNRFVSREYITKVVRVWDSQVI